MMKRVAVLGWVGVMLALCACYTVVKVPQYAETTVWENEEEFADSLETPTQKATVIQNYYIYDDWPGHWYYDPFWVSPYSWHFSTWWWIDYYDPWWRPWYWYGYYPWRPHYYFGFYYGSWDFWPGYYDPYWVYADGWHRVDYKPRPFERHELLPRRREVAPPLFTASGSSGLGRMDKTGARRSSSVDDESRRIRRTDTGGTQSKEAPSMSTERRIRRTESSVSERKASTTRERSSTSTPSVERRQRRESPSSTTPLVERRSPNYSPPPSSSHPQGNSSSNDRSGSSGHSGGDSGRRTRR